MVEIGDRVHKIEQILYGNEYTKERGLIESTRCIEEDLAFYKRFSKWLAWGGGIVAGGVFTLLGLGLKYNIDLLNQLSFLTSKLIEHMANK